MQNLTKAQLAAAVVAVLGLSLHGAPSLAADNTDGVNADQTKAEKKHGLKIAKKDKKDKEKGAEGSCKGKEKGKEGSCKGKEKGKEGSCKGKEKGKEGSCKGKESKDDKAKSGS